MAFWEVYPRRVARAEAWEAWQQVGAAARAGAITAAIVAQTEADFRFREARAVPHAATWLRGSRWDDEVHGAPAVSEKVSRSRAAWDEVLGGRKVSGE